MDNFLILFCIGGMAFGVLGLGVCCIMLIYTDIKQRKEWKQAEQEKKQKLILWLVSHVPNNEYENYVNELFQNGGQEKRGIVELITGKEWNNE